MSVLLKDYTIREVFDLCQEHKNMQEVADIIGVKLQSLYQFRSSNNTAFKRLKEEVKREKASKEQSKDTVVIKAEKVITSDNETKPQTDESNETIKKLKTKIDLLEKEKKSQEKKIKHLTTEKNNLHGQVHHLTEEVQQSNELYRELNIEYQKVADDYKKTAQEKTDYKDQLDELIRESNEILSEAKKYREINAEYQNKIAILSERTLEQDDVDIEKIRRELAFYKEHALMYYQKVNEVS